MNRLPTLLMIKSFKYVADKIGHWRRLAYQRRSSIGVLGSYSSSGTVHN